MFLVRLYIVQGFGGFFRKFIIFELLHEGCDAHCIGYGFFALSFIGMLIDTWAQYGCIIVCAKSFVDTF